MRKKNGIYATSVEKVLSDNFKRDVCAYAARSVEVSAQKDVELPRQAEQKTDGICVCAFRGMGLQQGKASIHNDKGVGDAGV